MALSREESLSISEQAWEDKLQGLASPANWETLRYSWAKKWKQQGRRVIGVLCTSVPEEIIYAAGMLPWRVMGTQSENITDTLSIRSANSCSHCNHVLQSVLDGELDFLDGVVATTSEQDTIRLWDVWLHLKKLPLMHIIHLPHASFPVGCSYFAAALARFKQAVEEFAGVRIGEAELREAIQVYDASRNLMSQVYELRKREHPPLSGAETLGLALAGTVMPKAEFNQELESLLPYLQKRRCSLKKLKPRLLISSDLLDDPRYLEIVERVGCLIAMDDLDAGSRYYWGSVGSDSGDAIVALARYYLYRPVAPWVTTWDKQAQQVVQWAKEFGAQGVLELVQRYSRAREMRRPFFLEALEKAGVRAISLEREYRLANVGQLQTRIQAFLETLPAM